MYQTTGYQLTHNYGNYSHSEDLLQSGNYQDVKDYFDECVSITQTKDNWQTDSLSIESILVKLNEDGDVEEVIDYLDVIDEHIFNQPSAC